MVDNRRTLGESARGYPYYVLNPPKIALVGLSRTRSAAVINGFSRTRPSTGFQVHGRRRFFGRTVVDEFSGAQSLLSRLRTCGINRWPSAAVTDSPSYTSIEHRTAGLAHV